MTPNKVVIAGSGSWGSALACAASSEILTFYAETSRP